MSRANGRRADELRPVRIQRGYTKHAEGAQVDHCTQRAADQPLDFLRAAGLLAAGRLALAARVGGARQHAVFGGHPAAAGVLEERRHALLGARGAQHLGVAELTSTAPSACLV